MELFLFRHAEFERLYNCSLVDIEAIPLEKRLFLMQSAVLILLCTIYYLLYVPCMFSISKYTSDNACYKVLFFIGCVNMANLWALGYFVAYSSLTGQVFCSNPILGYFIGLWASGLWICESSADILLAFNRCVEILWPKLGKCLFDKARTWIWCTLCGTYALGWFIFGRSAPYSSTFFGGWFFSPYAGYLETEQEMYEPSWHVYHNLVTAFAIPAIYLLFALAFLLKYQSFHTDNFVGTSLRVFLQVLCISLLNTIGALLYIWLQKVTDDTQMVTSTGQFFWFHIHGLPPVVYILMNPTIRQDCREFVKSFIKTILSREMNRVGTTIDAEKAEPNVEWAVRRSQLLEKNCAIKHK